MKNQATSSEERVARQPKMNVKLLRRIQKHILAEPRRYFQDKWQVWPSYQASSSLSGDAPPCGTMGCIAGWACQLTDGSIPARPKYRAADQLPATDDPAVSAAKDRLSSIIGKLSTIADNCRAALSLATGQKGEL